MNKFIELHTRLINLHLVELGVDEDSQAGIDIPVRINLDLLESYYPWPNKNEYDFNGCKLFFTSGREMLVTEQFEQVRHLINLAEKESELRADIELTKKLYGKLTSTSDETPVEYVVSHEGI